MSDTKNEWNISLAGCAFMGVYYVGVATCLQERASYILDKAAKICGASSGALFGAVIVCKVPLSKTYASMMDMAKEARKRSVGALHPSFNLLKIVHDFLEHELPDEAHLLANGRLFVSLTRVSDGKNLLVSHFHSKEDLIQALMCSCFFPPFCGWIPPSFRGIRYIDGAITNNLPFWKLKNTLTVSPFSGETDISPRESPFYHHEVQYNNVSIYLNFNNVYRVASVFLPPEPEVLSQMCRDGYKDTLQFLHENNLLKLDLLPELSFAEAPPSSTTCSEFKQLPGSKNKKTKRNTLRQKNHDVEHKQYQRGKETTNLLPISLEKVISESSKEMDGPYAAAQQYAFVRVLVQILMLCILPVEFAFAFAYRLIEWAPEMASDLQWLCSLTWDLCKLVYNGPLTNRPEVEQKSNPMYCHQDLQTLSSQSLPDWEISDAALLYPTPPATPTLPTTPVKCHAA